MRKNLRYAMILICTTVTLKAQNIQLPTTIKLFNLLSAYSSTIAIGDIDNDGDNDILEFNSDSFCYAWLENNGHGYFQNYHLIKNFSYGSYSQIKILDVNKDGINDIVAISNDPYTSVNGSFYYFKGKGNGNFESTYFNIYYSNFIDYENDGDMDIVYVKDSSIYINRNTLNGFSSPEKIAHLPKLPACVLRYVKIADLNSDNHPDLLFLTSGNPQYIFRSLNDGFDNFLKIDTIDKNTDFTYANLLVEDLNNDGSKDIIARSYQTYWFQSTNNARTYKKQHLTVGGTNLIIEDINKDGYKDVVTSGYDYLVNNKDNTFTRNTLTRAYGNNCYSIASGDIDNDKDIDVVMGQHDINDAHVLNLYFNNFCKPSYNVKYFKLCYGDSLLVKGKYIKSDGLFITDTLVNSIGCDSLIASYIFINPCIKKNVDTTICVKNALDTKVISQCDTTFNSCSDSLSICSMTIFCRRSIYMVCDPLSVISSKSPESTIVFPNPTKDKIFIDANYIQYYELFDLNGRLLIKSEYSGGISLDKFQSGIYILKVYNKKGLNKIVKLIKE